MTSSFYSRRGSHTSESSAEVVDSTDSECFDDNKEVFGVLEQKVDRLNDLFLEQCRLLTEIKEELHESKTMVDKSEFAQNKFLNELMKKTIAESSSKLKELEPPAEPYNSRSRSLLAAIETKQTFCLDRELKEALTDLLQTDELKERMVSATTSALGEVMRSSVARELPRLYGPLLQRQRRLPRQLASTLARSFAQLEAHSTQLANSICRVTRSLRRALDRHQSLLETSADGNSILRSIVEETLQKEMQEWRRLALDTLLPVDNDSVGCEWAERGATPPPLEYPGSPPQPAHPDSSIIDQLMKTAEINKQIQDGEVNSAFERALSAADLSLVMAACRAAEVAQVFVPCRLEQNTLLSLAQQLPTDMVHDTQLKCRYLEETLLNLNPLHPVTRAHLPLVVGEIRKHLTQFLAKFPSHLANRRIMLILMAADNLLK
ncbi:enhancer of mRNA-decapping protein 4-like isoform X2 [Pectinophora gossypiella]|nr:enhancer of mRNA-decapping protein 4-like isoform X2 [Pectinophora gossypiella]